MTAPNPLETLAAVPPFYLGRQPILDRDGQTVAYELLFRPDRQNGVVVTDDRAATASVIAHAFTDLGIQSVLGERDGLINFDAELLLSDIPELLPAARIVIEILETVAFTPEILVRCRELKQQGFRLALDDVSQFERLAPEVLELIDIVKIDLAAINTYRLPRLAAAARAAGVTLLAEKVESLFLADSCRELGFDLFQGYYFARPMLLEGRRSQPDRHLLLQLLQQVANNAPMEELEDTFKRAPELTFKLMRLVNSVGMGLRNRIHSLSHALVVIGERQLHRWLQVLLYAHHEDGVYTAPLLTLAATRGRLMELIAQRCIDDPRVRDQAFMTGMVSLLDTLFDTPMEELLAQVNLGDEIRAALLARSGRLGRMLQLVEALERKDPGEPAELLGTDMQALHTELPGMQIAAMNWANELGTPGG